MKKLTTLVLGLTCCCIHVANANQRVHCPNPGTIVPLSENYTVYASNDGLFQKWVAWTGKKVDKFIFRYVQFTRENNKHVFDACYYEANGTLIQFHPWDGESVSKTFDITSIRNTWYPSGENKIRCYLSASACVMDS